MNADQHSDSGNNSSGSETEPADGDDNTGTPEVRRSRSSLLALPLSLLALAAAGWLLWEHQMAPAPDASRLADAEIQSLKRSMSTLEGAADYNAEAIQQLTGRLDAQGGRIDTIPVRMDQIEELLTNLPATDEDARRKILNLEADWYLRLAETQLSVARNIGATQVALALADERFAQLANPSLTPIRDRIAAAIGELQIRQQHPLAEEAGVIQAIIDRIPTLPLQANLPENYGRESATTGEGEGVDRAMNSIRKAFTEVISVKRTDGEVLPQLNDADAAILRRSLLLDLQTAKLALLQDETAIYRQSLEVVDDRLRQWFEQSSTPVADAIAAIEALLNSTDESKLPDIAAIREDLQRARSSTP